MLGQTAPLGPFCNVSQFPEVTTTAEPRTTFVSGLCFRIYPNPSAGVFTVHRMVPGLSNPVMLELTDLRGARVWSGIMESDRKEFNVAGMAPGLYLLKLKDHETTEILKVVNRLNSIIFFTCGFRDIPSVVFDNEHS